MDLFDYLNEQKSETEGPLASRLRPRSLDEVVGQQHILGRDKMLYRAIRADKLSSVILFGPPGTGKTTIAQVIAASTKANFRQINATTAGKKDMEEVVEEARTVRAAYGRKTILFIDEIHRFNKAQQDYLLPYVENGTVILIGATTENPFFEVNKALLSRSNVFELKPLEKEDVAVLVRRAVNDKERGMGVYGAVIDEEAVDFLADMTQGAPSTPWSLPCSPRSRPKTERSISRSPSRRSASRGGAFATIRAATVTTTSSPPSSRACAAPIRTPRSTGSPG